MTAPRWTWRVALRLFVYNWFTRLWHNVLWRLENPRSSVVAASIRRSDWEWAVQSMKDVE